MSQPQNLPLADYYAKRAREYERIYSKPERQRDLFALTTLFQQQLAGKDVLEIACGTGYWTQFIAKTARSIVGMDIGDEVLEIAQAKRISDCPVCFKRADAFRVDEEFVEAQFTAAFSAFWWSHLRRSEIEGFLSRLVRVLTPGALVIFADNRFVPGSNTPISRTDSEGNTFQNRRMENGEEFEVLKNFPTRAEVEAALSRVARNITWTELEYFWIATGETKH